LSCKPVVLQGHALLVCLPGKPGSSAGKAHAERRHHHDQPEADHRGRADLRHPFRVKADCRPDCGDRHAEDNKRNAEPGGQRNGAEPLLPHCRSENDRQHREHAWVDQGEQPRAICEQQVQIANLPIALHSK
jgi:hypothetical protein